MDAAGFAGPLHLFFGDSGSIEDQIFPDRPFKKPGVLQDHAEMFMDFTALHLPDADAVQQDIAAGGFIKAHEQVHDRGLARAGQSDDGYLLSGTLLGSGAQARQLLC